MGQRLPFTVIGGFLGAGKTTLLNHWLRHADGQRLAVLVNDFGALNIDAGLIKAHSGDTIALTNGCVCCQIGDDLSMALIGVLQQRERFDAVVVEASGVSDPGASPNWAWPTRVWRWTASSWSSMPRPCPGRRPIRCWPTRCSVRWPGPTWSSSTRPIWPMPGPWSACTAG